MTFDIHTINTSIELFGILICITIILCRNFLIGSHQQKLRAIFTSLVFCEVLCLFTSAMCSILSGADFSFIQRLLEIIYFFRYFFIYVLLGLFTEYVSCFFQLSRVRIIRLFTWGLLALSVATLIANFFYPFYYDIDPSGVCLKTKFYQLLQIPCFLVCFENLVYVFFRKNELSNLTFISFLLYILIPVFALFVQTIFIHLDIINIALIVVMMYMFVVMQNRIVNEYIEQKKQLQESRTRLMMSQIKPHFLFNSLASIVQLCDDDPKLAKSTTISFANYLRKNLASIEKTEPIPFSEELNHIRNYLQIESVRFGELLHIVYDIETEDFKVPALSIQPLVENAVKHGVGMKEDGGMVTLSVLRCKEGIRISIVDDGVGFDPAEPISETGIGIRNSTERLHVQCHANVQIESIPGSGTTVTIFIPAEREGT